MSSLKFCSVCELKWGGEHSVQIAYPDWTIHLSPGIFFCLQVSFFCLQVSIFCLHVSASISYLDCLILLSYPPTSYIPNSNHFSWNHIFRRRVIWSSTERQTRLRLSSALTRYIHKSIGIQNCTHRHSTIYQVVKPEDEEKYLNEQKERFDLDLSCLSRVFFPIDPDCLTSYLSLILSVSRLIVLIVIHVPMLVLIVT